MEYERKMIVGSEEKDILGNEEDTQLQGRDWELMSRVDAGFESLVEGGDPEKKLKRKKIECCHQSAFVIRNIFSPHVLFLLSQILFCAY